MMEKFVTKENVFIAVIVAWMLIQTGYFATKMDLANVKLDMAQMKSEMQTYSDTKDEAILKELDTKYEKILQKLDKIK